MARCQAESDVVTSTSWRAVHGGASGRSIILGIRPEHFEDDRLVGGKPGGTVTTRIDLVESMGSDVYAYLSVRAFGLNTLRNGQMIFLNA